MSPYITVEITLLDKKVQKLNWKRKWQVLIYSFIQCLLMYIKYNCPGMDIGHVDPCNVFI